MTTEGASVGQLWRIVEAWLDASEFGDDMSQRKVAKRFEVTANALAHWRDPKSLPKADSLARIAHVTRTPYRVVLEAALHDADYLPVPPLPPEGGLTFTEDVNQSSLEGAIDASKSKVTPPSLRGQGRAKNTPKE